MVLGFLPSNKLLFCIRLTTSFAETINSSGNFNFSAKLWQYLIGSKVGISSSIYFLTYFNAFLNPLLSILVAVVISSGLIGHSHYLLAMYNIAVIMASMLRPLKVSLAVSNFLYCSSALSITWSSKFKIRLHSLIF